MQIAYSLIAATQLKSEIVVFVGVKTGKQAATTTTSRSLFDKI